MGADAINFFQWRQSACGAEAFHSSMVPHAGENTAVFHGVCELGEALRMLSEAGVQGSELRRSGTAILFSAESEWATRSETLPSMKLDHWHDVRDWYRGYLEAGQRADVVPLSYDWSGYATIVLPTVLVLCDANALRIADFVRAGGTVIVGYATGLVDEHFHVGLGGYPGAGDGLLREVLGVRSEEFNILDSGVEGEARDAAGADNAVAAGVLVAAGVGGAAGAESVAESRNDSSAITLSNGLSTRLWQNDVTSVASDCRVLATYTGVSAADWELDGVPAITSHPYGEGTAIYVGCDLDRHGIARFLGSLGAGVDAAADAGSLEASAGGVDSPHAGSSHAGSSDLGSSNAGDSHADCLHMPEHAVNGIYPTGDPCILHTIRESADSHIRFDFYLSRAGRSSMLDGVEGEPVIAYRCHAGAPDPQTGAVRHRLDRNAVLITKTVL
jgi:beta-galactosidase